VIVWEIGKVEVKERIMVFEGAAELGAAAATPNALFGRGDRTT